MDDGAQVLDRREGRSGELVLRRRGGGLEVICNGAFLIAESNEVSSRALVAAAASHLPARRLLVLIGGLGLGYALDEALSCPRVASVTTVELEPVIVEWFTTYCGARAGRAARDRRSRIVVGDVGDHLRDAHRAFDLVALDTDNGPGWLVRDGNARLYSPAGVRAVAEALLPGGVAVFWSPVSNEEFARRLGERFDAVDAVVAHDVVDGRRFDYTMYVCRRPAVTG